MTRKRWASLFIVVLACTGVMISVPPAAAQEEIIQGVDGAAAQTADDLAASKALRGGPVGAIHRHTPTVSFWSGIIPELTDSGVTWLAVVIILVLLFQSKPLFSLRNLDAIALALTALLLPLRTDVGALAGDTTGHTVQWWTYLLLSIVGVYWLARGVRLLLSSKAAALKPNVSEGAMFVLIAAGLCVAINTIATAPLSDGSRDGLVGGVCFADTGRLPYGDETLHDARSPLLYMLHAAMVKLDRPTYVDGDDKAGLTWGTRQSWLQEDTWSQIDLRGVRLTNGALFLLFLLALGGIGHRSHSVAGGHILVAIACIFPGALECLARPEIMLPATLIAWSIALATVPRVGGLLSLIVIVMAGFTSAWAWLAVPVLLAYFLRQGWQSFGATIGLLGAAAAALFGMLSFITPSLPHQGGALAELLPEYEARTTDDGALVLSNLIPDQEPKAGVKSRVWKFLLARDKTLLAGTALQIAPPNGVAVAAIPYMNVLATGPAHAVLQNDYRSSVARESDVTRLWAALRTLIEQTWKPEIKPAAPGLGAWKVWGTSYPELGERWNSIRRYSKLGAGVLALLAAFMLIRGRRPVEHELFGALLIVFAATLLVRLPGAATDWVWLLPAVLAGMAAKGANGSTAAAPPPIRRLPPLGLDPAPRITVEKPS